MKGNALDFSFSGLKTAVLRWVEAHDMEAEIAARALLLREHPRPPLEQWLAVTPQRTLDLLASFQHAVISRTADARRRRGRTIGRAALIVSGGVACELPDCARPRRRPPAVPGVLPLRRPLHRQRRHDRRRGFPQA